MNSRHVSFAEMLGSEPWKFRICECGSILVNQETKEVRGCTCDKPMVKDVV